MSINPNLLTLIGSIPPSLFFLLIMNEYYKSGLILIPFLLIDALDGTLARLTGKETAFGEFLDSTIDRISDFLLITAFAFGKIVRFEIVVVFLLTAFMVSYARARGELACNKKVSFTKGLMQRTERIIGILFSLIAFIIAPGFKLFDCNAPELIFILLFLLTFITFVQRVIFAYKNL